MKTHENAKLSKKITQTLAGIGPLDQFALKSARERQFQLVKPSGSLGVLEDLSIKLAGITSNPSPTFERKAIIIMAGDHGVAAEGVSAFPTEVTSQMVLNFMKGGAAINSISKQVGAKVIVADLGVAVDLVEFPNLIKRKIGYGTQNMINGPAMNIEQGIKAVEIGIDIVQSEISLGLDLVGMGEMGIGNSTSSSAIVAAITGLDAEYVTGRGTGINNTVWEKKVKIIKQAIQTNCPNPNDPIDVLTKMGGFEIAALVGLIFGAAANRIPIILDGFITTAAALIAVEWHPPVRDYLVASHKSTEIGHNVTLERLDLLPLLDLHLRLGEGTGAALSMPLIEIACNLMRDMLTFSESGVSNKKDN